MSSSTISISQETFDFEEFCAKINMKTAPVMDGNCDLNVSLDGFEHNQGAVDWQVPEGNLNDNAGGARFEENWGADNIDGSGCGLIWDEEVQNGTWNGNGQFVGSSTSNHEEPVRLDVTFLDHTFVDQYDDQENQQPADAHYDANDHCHGDYENFEEAAPGEDVICQQAQFGEQEQENYIDQFGDNVENLEEEAPINDAPQMSEPEQLGDQTQPDSASSTTFGNWFPAPMFVNDESQTNQDRYDDGFDLGTNYEQRAPGKSVPKFRIVKGVSVNRAMSKVSIPSLPAADVFYEESLDAQKADEMLNKPLAEGVYLDTKQVIAEITSWRQKSKVSQTEFAEKILDRTQGTFSGLVRNPKDFSELFANGKEVFVRMHNWLQLDDKTRNAMWNLQLFAPKEKKMTVKPNGRCVIAPAQKQHLEAVFRLVQHLTPNQTATLANDVGLSVDTVSNFFKNKRRRQK